MIEQPPKRPPGVTAKQWRLAAIYPRAETAYQALVEAGYSVKTAQKNACHQLGTVGVQRAFAVQAEARRDRASEIDDLAAAELVKRLQPSAVASLHAADVAQIWGGARKVRVELPLDTDSTVGDFERLSAQEYIRNVVKAVLIALGHETTDASLDELIDASAASVQEVVPPITDAAPMLIEASAVKSRRR